MLENNDFVFHLEDNDFKAELIDYLGTDENIIIPKSFLYDSHEYIISVFGSESENNTTKSISFAKDSQVEEIDDLSSFANLENLNIPSSVSKFGKRWCFSLKKLINITISPQNPYLSYFDEQMILSKLDEKSENYDLLVFVRRNIEKATIPSFIKKIDAYSFSNCMKLTKIVFSENSELTEICEFAFCESDIRKIKIPSKITRIQNGTFTDCFDLISVEFEKDSELRSIGPHAFMGSGIEKLEFPSKLEKLEENWCFDISFLNNITISPENKFYKYIDNKLIGRKSKQDENICDAIVFALRDICSVIIPSYIKKIKSCAFADCNFLRKVEFSNDSKLTCIGIEAFGTCKFKSMIIPKSVCKIKKEAFVCGEIESIEVLSENILIEDECFNSCNLILISFPKAKKVVCMDTFIHYNNNLIMFIDCHGIIELFSMDDQC